MSQDHNHSVPNLEEQYLNGCRDGKVLAYLATKPVITGISDDYTKVQVISRKRDMQGNFIYEAGEKRVADIIADLDKMSNNYRRTPLICKNTSDLQEHFEHIHGILYVRTNLQKSIDALNSVLGQNLSYLPHIDEQHADTFKKELRKELKHFNHASVKPTCARYDLRNDEDSILNHRYDRVDLGENKPSEDVWREIATSAVWNLAKNAFPRN